MIYISESDYAIARLNGIKRATVYARVMNYGWPLERAIKEKPVGRSSERTQWRKKAERNGISGRLFTERVSDGWSFERAATEPKNTNKEALSRASDAHLTAFTRKQLDTAKANGLKYDTILARVRRHGWSPNDAVKYPVGTRNPKKRRRA